MTFFDYDNLKTELSAITNGVDNLISNLANASALIYQSLDCLNWVGFYLIKNDVLELGPFQGKIACTKIPVGRGVCGTAVLKNKTQLVRNVHEFSGHIACDCASNSEIVIPIHKEGTIFGVLDIDSPLIGRFSLSDQKGLEDFVRLLETII